MKTQLALVVAPLALLGAVEVAAGQATFELDGTSHQFDEVSAFRIRDQANTGAYETFVIFTREAPDRQATAQARDPRTAAINDPSTEGGSLSMVVDGAEQPLPIIDMHMHAKAAADFGPPPRPLCIPITVHGVIDPQCPEPILSPLTDQAMIEQTVAALERRNIIGVLSGHTLDKVRPFLDAAPDRFIPAYGLELGREDTLSPGSLRRHLEAGEFEVLGEIANQYAGIAPDDERMEPYWALAEELDVPVAIHLGEGYPGAPYLDDPEYRAALGSPFLLEDVLVRHPKLRVYVMHYGSPLVEEMIAVLYTHPQVYVDIGGIQWTYPRKYFYGQLERFIDAGFGKRVMFGSDQMVWPGLIEPAIEIIEEAPFLSDEQKRDIFYNNAARFLRLSEEEIAKHHGEAGPSAPGRGGDAGSTCMTQVTVIDLETGESNARRNVVIAGDRILEVPADLGDLANRCVVEVDGRGKYLIPGLWDMHVHGTRYESTYPLYLANGVTGVREMFGPSDAGAFRAALEGRQVEAPRIFLGSPVVDGTPPIWPRSVEVETTEDARRAVAEQEQRKASFIKVYERLPREAYFAILAEGLHQGVPVVGHVPSSVTPWEVTAAGQKTIEHLTQIPLACSSDEDRLRQVAVRSYAAAISLQVEASHSFSPAKCQLLYAAFRRNGTWVVPTLTVLRSDGWRNDAEFRDDDRLRYFDEDTRAWLEPPLDTSPEDDATAARARELLAFHKRLVGEMFDAGVPILAGTDALNPFVFPGFSLHDELALLVDSGLTPLAALQAATTSAAAFMSRSDDYSSVAPGKLADLVLLRANPLEDIRNTTEIAAVFLGAKLFDRAALDELLAVAEAGAGTIGSSR